MALPGIKTKERHTKNGKKKWDDKIPLNEYFEELKRVSKNQIVWGGNYMTEYLYPTPSWIFWDKGQDLTMSDGELAYTSFKWCPRTESNCRIRVTKAA